jgi:hypothetical protein
MRSNIVFNVNANASIVLTARLEELNKSAFPSAVRNTLNDAAFEMKIKNIPESANLQMKVKNKTFFKKFTGVERARGFSVNNMHSKVGFSGSNRSNEKKALLGMHKQEFGGLDPKGLQYLKPTRIGKTATRNVKISERYKKSDLYKPVGKESFTKQAYKSFKGKRPFLVKDKKGRKWIARTKSFKRGVKKKKAKINIEWLMRDRAKKPTVIKRNSFNKKAALQTRKHIDDFYKKNATFQFNKALKKVI